MKAVAYSVRPFEREFLARANQKKHDITLISNALGMDTLVYAQGKTAVIVFTNDDLSAKIIVRLAALGIKYIVTRSVGTDHIDMNAAEKYKIRVTNVPWYSPEAIAEHAVAVGLALSRQLIRADRQVHRFDFRNDDLVGFNFSGKTVGIIGLGNTGQATARIFNGMGCHVIGFDPRSVVVHKVATVTLAALLATADIISLHLPLTMSSKYLINKSTLDQMKQGVMLINTSRGALMNTAEVLRAVESGRIGYLGIDVYEFEKGLFFEDHEYDSIRDPLLQSLLEHPNVLVTPHQAYLTREALQEIAFKTIMNLDSWHMNETLRVPVLAI